MVSGVVNDFGAGTGQNPTMHDSASKPSGGLESQVRAGLGIGPIQLNGWERHDSNARRAETLRGQAMGVQRA